MPFSLLPRDAPSTGERSFHAGGHAKVLGQENAWSVQGTAECWSEVNRKKITGDEAEGVTGQIVDGLQILFKILGKGFLGGTVVKNLPANAGDMGSSPGPGRSHMPRSN